MIFYISDMHFGHKNVIKFDNRPFNDVDEMDAELIRLWNSKVSADDHVYIIEYMHNKGRALNAGCMLNGFTPASFEELIINNQSFCEYSCAAEPPVQCSVSHLSRRSEPQ